MSRVRRKKTWTPGKEGHVPVNGRCFFIHRESRMTRTWDMGTLPVPVKAGWEQVSLEEYEAFRKQTQAMPRKKRQAVLATYKGKSA